MNIESNYFEPSNSELSGICLPYLVKDIIQADHDIWPFSPLNILGFFFFLVLFGGCLSWKLSVRCIVIELYHPRFQLVFAILRVKRF